MEKWEIYKVFVVARSLFTLASEHQNPSKGETSHALGARMRIAFDKVGAM